MSCLGVIFYRIGGSISSLTRIGDRPRVTFTRQGGMSVRFGLVCGANLGESYLYATDELLITLENGKLVVKRA